MLSGLALCHATLSGLAKRSPGHSDSSAWLPSATWNHLKQKQENEKAHPDAENATDKHK